MDTYIDESGNILLPLGAAMKRSCVGALIVREASWGQRTVIALRAPVDRAPTICTGAKPPL